MDARSRAACGLVNYVHEVAGVLDDDVVEVDVDVEEGPATAIIILRSRMPTFAEFPLLLTWDEISGWAVRVEISGDGDTTPLSYLGEEILPPPVRVRRYLWDSLVGRYPGTLRPRPLRHLDAADDLEHRLARFG